MNPANLADAISQVRQWKTLVQDEETANDDIALKTVLDAAERALGISVQAGEPGELIVVVAGFGYASFKADTDWQREIVHQVRRSMEDAVPAQRPAP